MVVQNSSDIRLKLLVTVVVVFCIVLSLQLTTGRQSENIKRHSKYLNTNQSNGNSKHFNCIVRGCPQDGYVCDHVTNMCRQTLEV